MAMLIKLAKFMGLSELDNEIIDSTYFTQIKNLLIESVKQPIVEALTEDLYDPLILAFEDSIVTPLVETFASEIISPITDTFNADIVTPIINSFSDSIISPIIASFADNITSPIVATFTANIINPITSWITTNVHNPLSTLLDSISSKIDSTTTFDKIFDRINVDSIKNIFLNSFVNPLLTKPLFGMPIDDPYKVEFSNGVVHVSTDSLFSDGHFYFGVILYDIFRKICSALYDCILDMGDFFNENIAGTEINFPIPLFSGKGLKIAFKIGEVWQPNSLLQLPVITTFDQLIEDFPWLNVWPLNIKLADGIIGSSGVVENVEGQWIDSNYKKSDLVYDITCSLILTIFIALLVYSGIGITKTKFYSKFFKHVPLKQSANMINNNFTYKQTSNRALMYILMLLTRGSSTNTSAVTMNLGNITGLNDVFSDLEVVADDDSVELIIKQLCDDIKLKVMSMYSGSYV